MKEPLKIVKVEVNTPTRKLNATWTRESRESREIAQETKHYVDGDVLMELTKMLEWQTQAEQLKAMSWLEYKAKWWETSDWEEMNKWAKEHCSGEYKVRQGTWMFKNEKDYIVFKLRWS